MFCSTGRRTFKMTQGIHQKVMIKKYSCTNCSRNIQNVDKRSLNVIVTNDIHVHVPRKVGLKTKTGMHWSSVCSFLF